MLWKAHEQNRKKGVIMSYPSLSGEEIKNKIGELGKMFVAIEGEKVIGTLALIHKVGKQWYNTSQYGYLCFGAVLPECSGKGVYRSLYQLAEASAKQSGLRVLTRDTNENNARMLKITKQEGYHFVELKPIRIISILFAQNGWTNALILCGILGFVFRFENLHKNPIQNGSEKRES